MRKLLSLLGSFVLIPSILPIVSFDANDKSEENELATLITNTNLGDIDDSNDQDVINKIIELNPNAPKDLYFIDNSIDNWNTYTNGSSTGILKSLSINGEVNIKYNDIIENKSSDANNSSAISNWSKANLSRKHVTNKKISSNKKTYYSEYFDYGMWQGNKIDDFINAGANLKHATVAFVTADSSLQNLVIASDSQQIIPAEANISGTFTHMFATNYIKPMYKANNNSFKGFKISFGGANSQAEVWDIAMNKYPDQPNKIIENIKENIINLCKNIAEIATGSSVISDYPKSIDFDIESWHDITDKNGVNYLFQALAQLKASDNTWEFSLTPSAVPRDGMTSSTIYMLSSIAKAYSEEKLDVEDLPIINPMCMDYGSYYSGNKAVSEFELARKTVLTVTQQYISALQPYYGDITFNNIISKMAATPMIGINDTKSEVFTLEDAKELYNWANSIGLAFIGNWSGNADNNGPKVGPSSDGLTYINNKDFSKTLNGDWTDQIIYPRTSPNN